jgi:hypothetical protein
MLYAGIAGHDYEPGFGELPVDGAAVDNADF